MDKTAVALRRKPHANAKARANTGAKTGTKSRAALEATFKAFLNAYALRDVQKVTPFLHDDVEWTISGPVDVLPFCGVHRGRDKVVDLIGSRVPAVLRVSSFVPESVVIDGDQVALLSRLTARRASDSHTISFRVANFFRFRDGQVIQNLSLLDSFDAVEQVIGHSLTDRDGIVPEMGDLVSI